MPAESLRVRCGGGVPLRTVVSPVSETCGASRMSGRAIERKGFPVVPLHRAGVRPSPDRCPGAVRGGRPHAEGWNFRRACRRERAAHDSLGRLFCRGREYRFAVTGRKMPFVAAICVTGVPVRVFAGNGSGRLAEESAGPVLRLRRVGSGPAPLRNGSGMPERLRCRGRRTTGPKGRRFYVFSHAVRRNADRFAKGIIFAPYRNRSAESKMKRLFAYIVWSCLLFAALWHSGAASAPSESRSDGDDVRCESLCEACGLHEWYRLVAESWQSDVPPLAAGVYASFAAAAVPRLLCRGRDVVQAVPPRLFLTEHPAVRLDVQRRDRDRMRAGLARSGHYVLALRKIVV